MIAAPVLPSTASPSKQLGGNPGKPVNTPKIRDRLAGVPTAAVLHRDRALHHETALWKQKFCTGPWGLEHLSCCSVLWQAKLIQTHSEEVTLGNALSLSFVLKKSMLEERVGK